MPILEMLFLSDLSSRLVSAYIQCIILVYRGGSVDIPSGPRFHPQHIPAVFAVANAADGVCLLLGESHIDLWCWPLPSVLTHVRYR